MGKLMKMHANPAGQEIDPGLWSVQVNGQTLDIFRASAVSKYDPADMSYAFGLMDLDAEAEIRVISQCRDLTDTLILPENSRVKILERSRHEIRLRGTAPFTIALEPEGRDGMPLLLFGKTPEKDVPDPKDPKVHYFGPGVHSPGRIELRDGETLYLASGALVHAVLLAHGEHIRVCGRGVLSQEKFARFKPYHCHDFAHCRDLRIEGVTFREPCGWNMVLRDCSKVRISGIQVCGSRMINDDAVDICNSRDVKITGSFFRAQDDIFAVKGLPERADEWADGTVEPWLNHSGKELPADRPVEDLEISECTLWCDIANVFRIGYECGAAHFRHFYFHDLEILHASRIFRPVSEFWNHSVFCLQASFGMEISDITFERIRICGSGCGAHLISVRSEACGTFTGCGSICDCRFQDIELTGNGTLQPGTIHLKCPDTQHPVKEISLKHVVRGGTELTAENTPICLEGAAEPLKFLR